MSLDLERILFKKKMFGRELAKEKYEDAINMIYSIPIDALANIVIDSIQNKKIFSALIISEAILRKPFLSYSLSLEFVKRNEHGVLKMLFVDEDILDNLNKLYKEKGRIDEDYIDSFIECRKYHQHASYDIKKCREDYISSLLPVSEISAKLLSSISSLALTPVDIKIRQEKPSEERFVILWPYVAVLNSKPWQITWYLIENKVRSSSIDLPDNVDNLKGLALKDRAMFIVTTSKGNDYAYIDYVDGKTVTITGHRVCVDNSHKIHVLRLKGEQLVISQYDSKGIAIYEKTLNISTQDVKNISCFPTPGDGVVFSLVSSRKTTLIISRRNLVYEYTVNTVVDRIITLPLGIIIGFTRDNVILIWFIPKENRVEVIEEQIPYTLPYAISNILAIPHIGIVVVANNGLHCINSVGVVRYENLYRWDKIPKAIDVISLPTFSILLLFDERSHIEKMFLLQEGAVKPVESDLIKYDLAKGIVHSYNTLCLILSDALRCFSPIFLKTVVNIGKEPLTNIKHIRDLLNLYKRSSSHREIVEVLYTGYINLGVEPIDSYLHKISSILENTKIKFSELDIEKLITRAINLNISLELLGFLLHELMSKTSNIYNAIKSTLPQVISKGTHKDLGVMLNSDAIISIHEAYSILSNTANLDKIDPIYLVKYCEKIRQGIESIGLKDIAIVGILERESIKNIIPKFVQLTERSINEVVRHLAYEYLKSFGIDLGLIKSRLNEVKYVVQKIQVGKYGEIVESRIRNALARGSIDELNNVLKYSQEILSDIQDILNKYRSSPFTADILQRAVDDVLQCLNKEVDLSKCKAKLREFRVCFEKLSSLYNEMQSIVSSSAYLKNVDVLRFLADLPTCLERARKAEYVLFKAKKMKTIIDKIEPIINSFESMKIKPKAVILVKEKIKNYVNDLDVDTIAKELSMLERYYAISKEFNEVYAKLRQLTDIPMFRDVENALNNLIQEFVNLDTDSLESFRNKIKRLMEIDIEEVKKRINSIHENLVYFKAPQQLLSNIVEEFLQRMFSLNVVEPPIIYLRELDRHLGMLRLNVDMFMQALERLISILRSFDTEKKILDEVYKAEKSSYIIMPTSVTDLLNKLNDYINKIIQRTSKARELEDKLWQIYSQIQLLEPELRESLLKLFISLISKESRYDIDAISTALSKFNEITKDVSLLEFNENLKKIKLMLANLKSVDAKNLINNIISILLKKISEGDFKEARYCLWFTYNIYGELIYKDIDSLILKLESAGLDILKYVKISENAYEESVKKILADINRFNEVKDILYKCPRCVVKLLNVSKDIDLGIKVLKFINRIEDNIEKLCKILDTATFNNIGQCLIEVLATIGNEVVGGRVDTREEKLALAYTILINHVKDVAHGISSCETISKESDTLRKIYNEFCLGVNIEEAIGGLALACLEKSSYECRVATELLGGYYVNQLIELINEITVLLGISGIDRSSLYKLVKEKIAEPIVRNGLQSFEEIKKDIETIRKGLEENIAVVRVVRGLPSELKEILRRDLNTLLQVIGLYIDRISKGRITLKEDYIELRRDGEIEDGKESNLKLKVCSRLPIPIILRGVSIDFIGTGYSISLANLRRVIPPRKCSENIDIHTPKLIFSSAMLHLGKEVASKVRLTFSLLGLPESDVDVYEGFMHIPVRYYGPKGEIIEVLEDVSRHIKDKYDVEIKVEKLSEIMLGVGGNNIVVLGTKGREKVAVKVPKFYKDAKKTYYGDITKCEELRNRCIEATRRCSSKSITPVYTIELSPPYAVEKYVEGVTLRRVLDEKRVLNISEAIAIAKKVGEGIRCLHEHGVYHNDIRPENIIVKRVGDRIEEVYIIDSCIDSVWNLYKAGLGVELITDKPHASVDVRYLHPDLVKLVKKLPGNPDAHMMIDVFQLGLLLSEMLLGYNPMDVAKSVEELNDVIAETPSVLRDIIQKALQPIKSRITLGEFIEFLENIKVG